MLLLMIPSGLIVSLTIFTRGQIRFVNCGPEAINACGNEASLADLGINWDYCIEALRQVVQCNADSTVLTHDRYEDIDEPVANDQNSRRCVD